MFLLSFYYSCRISKPKVDKLRRIAPKRTSESFSIHKPKQEPPYNPGNFTNFIDCKLKVQKLDRIIKALRLCNSRQTINIMSLQNNLTKLMGELSKSNQALALLLEPNFEFAESQSSS